jgi:hypothetical protein
LQRQPRKRTTTAAPKAAQKYDKRFNQRQPKRITDFNPEVSKKFTYLGTCDYHLFSEDEVQTQHKGPLTLRVSA